VGTFADAWGQASLPLGVRAAEKGRWTGEGVGRRRGGIVRRGRVVSARGDVRGRLGAGVPTW